MKPEGFPFPQKGTATVPRAELLRSGMKIGIKNLEKLLNFISKCGTIAKVRLKPMPK